MATIDDVARLSGVSRTTVSRVLNYPELVNENTRKKVIRVMKKLHYSPSILAQGLRSQKTRMIGVIIPDFSNLFYSEMLRYIEKEAQEKGYIAIICSTELKPEKEIEYINRLIKRQVEGLILCWYKSVHDYRGFLIKLSRKVPIVVMDQPSGELPISSVYTDGYKGIKKLTEYMISKGYRRIAILRGLKNYPVVEPRYRGYLDALKEHNIPFNEFLVEETGFTAAEGYNATKRLLTRVKPEAIVAITDLIAIGSLKYVQEKGYIVPDDIAIGGFDNIPLTSLVSPQLTTVAQPISEMAREATNHLIIRAQNRKIRTRDIVLENELIVRESTDIEKKDKILM